VSVFDSDYAEDQRETGDLYLGAPGWDYPEEPEPDDRDEWNGTDSDA
jgi:hypothetical protein